MQIKIKVLIKINNYNIIIVEQKYNKINKINNRRSYECEWKCEWKKKLFNYLLFIINIVNYFYLQLNQIKS